MKIMWGCDTFQDGVRVPHNIVQLPYDTISHGSAIISFDVLSFFMRLFKDVNSHYISIQDKNEM